MIRFLAGVAGLAAVLAADAPPPWTTYRSVQLGVELQAPPHWAEEPAKEGWRLRAPEKGGPELAVTVRDGTLAEAVRKGRWEVSTVFQSGKILSEGPFPPGSKTAYAVSASSVHQGRAVTRMLAFIEMEGQVYLLDCAADREEYAKLKPSFERIAGSLRRSSGTAEGTEAAAPAGVEIPEAWLTRRDARTKLVAKAPPDWAAVFEQGVIFSERHFYLALSAPDEETSGARMVIGSRPGTVDAAVRWARAEIEGLPRGKLLESNPAALRSGRDGHVLVFSRRELGGAVMCILTLIDGKGRTLMTLAQADFKSFERYNAVFNAISGSVEEYRP